MEHEEWWVIITPGLVSVKGITNIMDTSFFNKIMRQRMASNGDVSPDEHAALFFSLVDAMSPNFLAPKGEAQFVLCWMIHPDTGALIAGVSKREPEATERWTHEGVYAIREVPLHIRFANDRSYFQLLPVQALPYAAVLTKQSAGFGDFPFHFKVGINTLASLSNS